MRNPRNQLFLVELKNKGLGGAIKQIDKNVGLPLNSVPLQVAKSVCGLPRNSVRKVHLTGRYQIGKECAKLR